MTEITRIGRERLANRRPSVTETIEWRGRPIALSVGFANDGRVLEIFARDAKPDSDRDCIADDAAVLISLDLQHGDDLAAIARGLGRLPDGSPSSIVGALVDAALRVARNQ